MNLKIRVTIEQDDGETGSGYPKTKTLGELNVEAEATRAWNVYRDALHQLTQPNYVIVPTGTTPRNPPPPLFPEQSPSPDQSS